MAESKDKKHATAGSPDPAGKAPEVPFDPELASDLGPELELRGDVLEAEIESLRAEAAEHRDRALRAQAEFDNFRKRITREREEERRRAGERLVAEMLPAVDNLERAIAHAEGGGDPEHLLGAVEAVYSQLQGVLGKEGVQIVDPTGEPFDPNTQQAVSQKEDDSVPEGTVVDVFQKGYVLGGRVIRSAMVVVSTGGPARQE
jgi:molecular chaperone GrpE